jgi:hypothetical protein
MKTILILVVLSVAFATYSEADAKRYVWASSLAYCNDLGKPGNCGHAETSVKNLGYEVVAYKNTGAVYNFINSVILKDVARKEFVVAFSGTKNPAQLGQEILNNLPTKYNLHSIEGASVLHYFLDKYALFSDWLEVALKKNLPSDYKVVFTGHSLGGALAVHAATDMLLEHIKSGTQMKVYTYGQPRIGNTQFDSVLKSQVTDTYRITHNKDLVVHVPPCIPNIISSSSPCIAKGPLAFYPYNSLKEIFYNEEMNSFTTCANDEDKKCADQFHFTSVGDHLTYFGVDVGGSHKK